MQSDAYYPDLPDCMWCGEPISDTIWRVDRWYLHDGCHDALRNAVDDMHVEAGSEMKP